MIRRVIPLFAAIVLSLTGCSLTRDPSITVLDATVTSATDAAIAFDIGLEIANPNDVELRLQDFRYSVWVNSERVFTGTRSAEATLAANDVRQVRVPAVIRFDQLGWSPQQVPASAPFNVSGNVSYIAPGEIARVFLDMGLPKPKATVSGTGEVAVR